MISKEDPTNIAKGVWEFGKALGLKNKGSEEALVRQLRGMEERDWVAAGGTGDGVSHPL